MLKIAMNNHDFKAKEYKRENLGTLSMSVFLFGWCLLSLFIWSFLQSNKTLIDRFSAELTLSGRLTSFPNKTILLMRS